MVATGMHGIIGCDEIKISLIIGRSQIHSLLCNPEEGSRESKIFQGEYGMEQGQVVTPEIVSPGPENQKG